MTKTEMNLFRTLVTEGNIAHDDVYEGNDGCDVYVVNFRGFVVTYTNDKILEVR